MKRFVLTVVVFAFVLSLAAQNPVLTAYGYYRHQQVAKAKEYIDKGYQEPKYSGEASTWMYRGSIYLQINYAAHLTDGLHKGMTLEEIKKVLGKPISIRNYKKLEDGSKLSFGFDLLLYLSKDVLVSWEYPNEALYKSLDDGHTLEVAYESYQKSIEINPKFVNVQISPMNAMKGLEQVSGSFYNSGIIAYENKNYKAAQYNLEQAVKTYAALNKKDAELVYYTGVACISAGDTTKALQYYNKAVKLNYKDKLLYYNLTNIYLIEKQIDKAKAAIAKGREYHPEDQDLLIMEANIYLQTGEATKAETILLEAVKRDPNNANLYYVVGANYDNILNDTNNTKEAKDFAFVQAQKAYDKAIQLNPNYFDANFNMGALLNNKAAEIFVYISNLPLSAEKEYEEGKTKAIGFLSKAQPYLETAHKLQPKDKDTLVLLKQIYMKTNNTEKFQEVNNLLKEL